MFDTEPHSMRPTRSMRSMRPLHLALLTCTLAANPVLADAPQADAAQDTPVITIIEDDAVAPTPPTAPSATAQVEPDAQPDADAPVEQVEQADQADAAVAPDEQELPRIVTPQGVASPLAEPVTVLDRSNWEVVVVRPESGVVTHGPIYFSDVTLWDPSPVGPSAGPTPEAGAYLEGATAAGYVSDNPLGLVVQPAKFAFDLVTLPVRAILQPPFFSTEQTPPTGWPQ